MAVNATFKPNLAGLRIFTSGPEMESALLSIAEGVVQVAKTLAPVDTGAYRDSIVADSGVEDGKAMARVNAWVRYASFIEFGTEDTPTFAVLRRAAEQSGLRVGRA